MYNEHQHIVTTEITENIRLADYLTEHSVFGPTKSFHKKEIKAGRIKINGLTATTGSYVKQGDIIDWQPGEDIKHDIDIPEIKILYEDDHLAGVYKPAGIETRGYQTRTVQNALHKIIRPPQGRFVFKPQAIHRLDYATAGVLLVGKHADAKFRLGSMFQQRRIRKKYIAVCSGNINDYGEIDEPIRGLETLTAYQKLASLASDKYGQIHLIGLMPITGRRHQLRIHMQHIGNPVLGDKIYGNDSTKNFGQGLYLLSYIIQFTHPFTKEKLSIRCEIPKKYKRLFPDFFKSK